MPYCPNCALELQADAPECPKCKANFGPESSWRLLAVPPFVPSELDEKQEKQKSESHMLLGALAGSVVVGLFQVIRITDEWADVAIPALLIAFAVLVAGVLIWALTGGRKRRHRAAAEQELRASAEKRLDQMMHLSEQTTTRVEHATLPPIETLVDRCRAATHATRACCAWIVHRDPQNEQLSAQGYLQSCWWIDFERPDRFLVSQQMWDGKLGNVFDQWVSVGEDTYQNAGLWMHGEKGAHRQFHDAYSIDGTLAFVEALTTTDTPHAYEVRKDDSGSYFHLRYDDPASRHGPLAVVEEIAQSKCIVDVWLGVDDAQLKKAQISIAGIDRDGNRGYSEVHRAFGCHNERVIVTPPPWINAVPSGEGGLTIIDDRVPVVEHYAISSTSEMLISDPSSTRAQELSRRIRSDSKSLH